jgi:hypothetical protein
MPAIGDAADAMAQGRMMIDDGSEGVINGKLGATQMSRPCGNRYTGVGCVVIMMRTLRSGSSLSLSIPCDGVGERDRTVMLYLYMRARSGQLSR